jgi:hypothetical protein
MCRQQTTNERRRLGFYLGHRHAQLIRPSLADADQVRVEVNVPKEKDKDEENFHDSMTHFWVRFAPCGLIHCVCYLQ